MKNITFIAIEKPDSIKDYLQFHKRMRGYEFDELLCLQSNLRANLLYPLIKAKRKIGYKKLRAREGHRFFTTESVQSDELHLLDHYFSFLRKIGVKESIRPTLDIDTASFETSFDLVEDKPFVLIHPCASKKVRNWGLGNMQRLVFDLAKRGLEVVITASENQKEYCQELRQGLSAVHNLAGQTDLRVLAALIKRAELVIAPDTGPLHMADILGTKLLGLYAASNPLASGPYYQRSCVVNRYPQALQANFPKKKNPPINFKVDSPGVMDLITYQEVHHRVIHILNERSL